MIRATLITFEWKDFTYQVFRKKYQNGKGWRWFLSRYNSSTSKALVVKFSKSLYDSLALSVETKGLEESASLAESMLSERKVVTTDEF